MVCVCFFHCYVVCVWFVDVVDGVCMCVRVCVSRVACVERPNEPQSILPRPRRACREIRVS